MDARIKSGHDEGDSLSRHQTTKAAATRSRAAAAS